MFAVWSRKRCIWKKKKKTFPPKKAIYSRWSTLGETLASPCGSCPLTRWRILFAVAITGWWQVALRLLVNSRDVSREMPQLGILAASAKRLCTPSEPLSMKHILRRLSIRPNTRHIASENIYKSLPAVTVIAGPNPVHCRCGWCASKTHKPTHIPECVSRPRLLETIMSEIFLCSLSTWSLQFGEMAAWLSVSGGMSWHCLIISSANRLCSHFAIMWTHRSCSRAWVGTGVLTGSPPPPPSAQRSITSHHPMRRDQRQRKAVYRRKRADKIMETPHLRGGFEVPDRVQ